MDTVHVFELRGQLLCTVLFISISLTVAANATAPEVKMIRWSDIPERAQIIGKLGRPLGEIVDIRGEWIDEPTDKPMGPTLAVSQVNGRTLSPPARFLLEDVDVVISSLPRAPRPTVGEIWDLRGVETGGFVGYSEEVWNEIGSITPQMQTGFLTRFNYIRYSRAGGGNDAKSTQE